MLRCPPVETPAMTMTFVSAGEMASELARLSRETLPVFTQFSPSSRER